MSLHSSTGSQRVEGGGEVWCLVRILTPAFVPPLILQHRKLLNKGTFMVLAVHLLPSQWVFKWDQASTLDERLRDASLPRRGNMFRAERFMVGIHPGNIRSGYCDTTYCTPNLPEGQKNRHGNSPRYTHTISKHSFQNHGSFASPKSCTKPKLNAPSLSSSSTLRHRLFWDWNIKTRTTVMCWRLTCHLSDMFPVYSLSTFE